MVSLRQLEVQYTDLEEVPETVSNLYNLQTLKLNYCRKLHKLLNDMGKMVSLRQLKICSCKNLKVLPALGRLEFLECLVLANLDSVSPIMGLEVLGVLNGDISAAPVIAFPKLKELDIWNMKHLQEWAIKTDYKYHCHASSSKTAYCILPYAEVIAMPNLIFFTKGNDNKQLSAFGGLVPSPISGEVGVITRWRFSFDIITHTKSLVIQYSPHSTLPQGLSQCKALQILKMWDCNSLTCIFEELQHLTSLRELDIYKCRMSYLGSTMPEGNRRGLGHHISHPRHSHSLKEDTMINICAHAKIHSCF
ncbi:hypothetical protein GIB67_005975 [Kingdonia uniflora]|nr:hypothetical protein GIB67_005975 [Kingdonia uniflora]